MSDVVLGVGASHSTLMNTHWDEVADLEGPQRFRDALGDARRRIAEAKPDVLLVIGSNHFRGMFLDLMPTLTIPVGECHGAGEAGTPAGPLQVDQSLALALVDHLVSAGFDPAFSLRLTVDHGITQSLQHLSPDLQVPVVPIILNMFAPPLMPLRRANALGVALRDAVRGDGKSKRVVVIASGGLSHRLPWPKWFSAVSEDDRFLVDAWLNGRNLWNQFESRRREIVRRAVPEISEEFDRMFLQRMSDGDVAPILEWSDADLESAAGNGAHEIRAWLAMASLLGPSSVETLSYEPVNEWLTGMAVAVFEPNDVTRGEHHDHVD